jgi:hypothetical protein
MEIIPGLSPGFLQAGNLCTHILCIAIDEKKSVVGNKRSNPSFYPTSKLK